MKKNIIWIFVSALIVLCMIIICVLFIKYSNQISQIIFGFTMNENTSTKCENIEESSRRDTCYGIVALNTSDNNLCEKIISERAKDICLSGVAKKIHNSSICNKIIENSLKYECKMSLWENILEPVDLVKRDNDKLILKLDNGSEKILKNIVGDDNHKEEDVNYGFDKLYNDINAYGINFQLYEGSGYLLIDKKSGESISVGSIVVSPNKERVLSYGLDLISGYNINGLKIIKLVDGNFIVEYDSGSEKWGSQNTKWTNDSGIEFEKIVLDDNYDEVSAGLYRLKLIDGKWVEFK